MISGKLVGFKKSGNFFLNCIYCNKFVNDSGKVAYILKNTLFGAGCLMATIFNQ